MDKYEYNLKLEEIDKLVDQGDYKEAANLADTIEWRRVRNVRTLSLISEIYEAAGELEKSKDMLVRAYRKSPVGRNVLYRLVEVTTELGQYDEALEYYSEYVQTAPHDNNRFILKYMIYKGRGSSVEDLIAILEEYLGQEYTERWAYELATLYQQAGQMQKCLATCDDLVLWFHSGRYVKKALELKKRYAVLTPKQQQIYEVCQQEAAQNEYLDGPGDSDEETVFAQGSEEADDEVIAENIIAETEKEIAGEITARKAELEKDSEPKNGSDPKQQTRVLRKMRGAIPLSFLNPRKAGKNSGAQPETEPEKSESVHTEPETGQAGSTVSEPAAGRSGSAVPEPETDRKESGRNTRRADSDLEAEEMDENDSIDSESEDGGVGTAPTESELSEYAFEEREIPEPLENNDLQIQLARSVRKVISGVARKPEMNEDDVPAAVEERLHLIQDVQRRREPEPVAARLSIDDILLSMEEKGRQEAERIRMEAAAAEEPGMLSEESEAAAEEPGMLLEESEAATEEPGMLSEESEVAVVEPEAAEEEAIGAEPEAVEKEVIGAEPEAIEPERLEAAESGGAETEPEAAEEETVRVEPGAAEEKTEAAETEAVAKKPETAEPEGFRAESEAAGVEPEAAEPEAVGKEPEAAEMEAVGKEPEAAEMETEPEPPVVTRSIASAAAEDLTQQELEAIKYSSNPAKFLKNRTSLPSYAEDGDLGMTRRIVNTKEELLEAARKELMASKTIQIPSEEVAKAYAHSMGEKTYGSAKPEMPAEEADITEAVRGAEEAEAAGPELDAEAFDTEDAEWEAKAFDLPELGWDAETSGTTDPRLDAGAFDLPESGWDADVSGGADSGWNAGASDTLEPGWDEETFDSPESGWDTEAPGADGIQPGADEWGEPFAGEAFDESFDEASNEASDEAPDGAAEEEYFDDALTLPPYLRGLFKGFTEIDGLEDQIENAIQQAMAKGEDRTSRNGNILIFGAHGSGKTTLATDIARAIAQERGRQVAKMARIYAADLNRRDIAATVAKIAGGTLIIEEAGDLDDSTIEQLTTAMEFRTDGLIVILEDEQHYIHDLLMKHPRFTMKFTAQIYLPVYTADELVMFAEHHAKEQDCRISEEGYEVIRRKVADAASAEKPMSISDVTALVDGAIRRSNKLMRRLSMGKKRYDENDYVILFAKDFK